MGIFSRTDNKQQREAELEQLRQGIIDKLRTIFDPEIPVSIFDLGLIYEIAIGDDNDVKINMTLTTPGCPVAQTFPMEVENKIREVEGVNEVLVELVWEPPWTQDMMTEDAKITLSMAYGMPITPPNDDEFDDD